MAASKDIKALGVKVVNRNDRWKSLRRAGQLSTLGIAMVLSVVIGFAMGHNLDKWLGTKPWLTLLFLIFGIIAGFRIVFKEVSKLGEEDSNEEGPDRRNGPYTGDQH